MAWNRVLDVYIGTIAATADEVSSGANVTKVCGVNPDTGLESLHCDATVTRSNRMKYNSAALKIYNLPKSLRTLCSSAGHVVRIDAGYKDQGSGTIFHGQIGSASHVLLEEGDYETTINAFGMRSQGMDFETLYVSMGYKKGTDLRRILEDLGQLLGVVVIGLSNAAIVTPNGWYHVGALKGALDYVADILRPQGLGLYYDISQLVVYRVGSAVSSFEEVYLDPDSGLRRAKLVANPVVEAATEFRSAKKIERLKARYAKAKTADGKTRIDQSLATANLQLDESRRVRVEFESLFNFRMRPSCLLHIDNKEDIAGDFILDDFVATLSNWGDAFDIKGVASRES